MAQFHGLLLFFIPLHVRSRLSYQIAHVRFLGSLRALGDTLFWLIGLGLFRLAFEGDFRAFVEDSARRCDVLAVKRELWTSKEIRITLANHVSRSTAITVVFGVGLKY